ncbi:MAG: hypothetical protein CM1200mP14_09350 [Gammaproteobacteria bacterium]|nr:MAG: hypothetical protein CM1200mP14_09350 [Gammaproteobacteria bacterium]
MHWVVCFRKPILQCWDPDGQGFNNLAEAIGNSCDVYFYQLGLRIGLDPLLRRSTEIGFSRQCGIDLPKRVKEFFQLRESFGSGGSGMLLAKGRFFHFQLVRARIPKHLLR